MARLALLCFALLSATPALAFDPVDAPAFEAIDVDGQAIAVGGQRDRPAVLFFWATWCPYCKQFMPHLQSIVDEYGGVDVLSISVFEEDDGDPAGYLEEYGFEFRLVEEGEAIASEYGVRGTPGVFVVDTEGRIRWHLGLAMQDEERVAGLSKHWQRATRRAPFWAAELRGALDAVTP